MPTIFSLKHRSSTLFRFSFWGKNVNFDFDSEGRETFKQHLYRQIRLILTILSTAHSVRKQEFNGNIPTTLSARLSYILRYKCIEGAQIATRGSQSNKFRIVLVLLGLLTRLHTPEVAILFPQHSINGIATVKLPWFSREGFWISKLAYHVTIWDSPLAA